MLSICRATYGVFGYEKLSADELGLREMLSPDGVTKARKAALERLRSRYPGSGLHLWRDVYHALKDSRIAGAGLDVFNEEPLRQSPLFELENVVFLPHLGGHSKGATHNMGRMNIDNILAVSAGTPCKNIVAP